MSSSPPCPEDSAALRRMMLENRDAVARALRARQADVDAGDARRMSLDEHRYALTVRWTGNLGEGTASYRGYSRDHDVEIPGLPVLRGLGRSDVPRGPDPLQPGAAAPGRSLQCHMLSFLHVAVKHGVVVTGYRGPRRGA